MAEQLKRDIIKRALRSGTVLAGTYQVEHVLGEGGFGITYAGRQLDRGQKVAIKEYFPAELASRENADSNQNLHIFRGEKELEFEKGRKRFLKEAEVLREFQYLDGIVTVMDYFECNHTAYIVMEYIEGITLKQYVRDNGALNFTEVIALLSPVMKSMIQIHKKDLIHRDISPDNLLIGLDNRARLIDFGAVNQVNEKEKKTKTVILKTGFAPPEQYLSTGKQGPWTDVYAFAAMMWFALTGETPTDSIARLQGADLPETNWESLGVEDWQRYALVKGMALKISDRFKNLEEFYTELTVKHLKEDVVTEHPKVPSKEIGNQIKRLNQKPSVRSLFVIGFLLIIVLTAGLLWGSKNWHSNETQQPDTSEVDTTADSREENMNVEAESQPVHVICTMPNVVDLPVEEAKTKILSQDDSIHIVIEEQYHQEAPEGYIINQNVEAGTTYNQGAIKEVVLIVSLGVEPVAEQTETKPRPASTTEDDFNYTEEDEYDEFQLGE